MTERQLNELIELTGELDLIKKIANEEIYEIDFIIEFMKVHRDLTKEELIYYIDKRSNCIYEDILYGSRFVMVNPNYSKEELKRVVDEIYKIDDLQKYDPRIELLKKIEVVNTLTSDELLELLNSDITLLSQKVYLIYNLCRNGDEEKIANLHSEINKIIHGDVSEEVSELKSGYQMNADDDIRSQWIRKDIIDKYLAPAAAKSDSDYVKNTLFDLKRNLDSIVSFERLSSIQQIFRNYDCDDKKLDYKQMELLIKLNAKGDYLSTSGLNKYLENLEITKHRTFDEIIAIAYRILPFKFYDNCLDAENILLNPDVLSSRTAAQTMSFVNELDKFVKEKHSYKGLKALYDMARNVSSTNDYETQMKQFQYVKSLENELDKECASKVFNTAGYLNTNFDDCVKFIDEIVKCDSPSKKISLTKTFRFVVENDNLNEEEKMALVKLVRKAETKVEAEAISTIIMNSKHLNLSDIYSLITLDERSSITNVMDAQRSIKVINKIKNAETTEEMADVFNSVPAPKKSGYYHF